MQWFKCDHYSLSVLNVKIWNFLRTSIMLRVEDRAADLAELWEGCECWNAVSTYLQAVCGISEAMILMSRFHQDTSFFKYSKMKKKIPNSKRLWSQAFQTGRPRAVGIFWCVSFQIFFSVLVVNFVFIKRQLTLS